MTTSDAQDLWDRQAAAYASGAGFRLFGRFLALYEESCWHYIEAVLPIVEGSLILEAGCGTGRWVYRLAPLGYRLVLSDLSPEMIQQAQTRVERMGLSERVTAYHVLDICDLQPLPEANYDLVLVLGGPLGLCQDASLAASELYRVTKPGGHVVCDAANRYRTALDLIHDGKVSQLEQVLKTGQFPRSDGLTDHRFRPQEFTDLLERHGLQVRHLVGICPFFPYLPSREQVRTLDDKQVFDTMLDFGRRCAEDPAVVGLSGRLLAVTQRQE